MSNTNHINDNAVINCVNGNGNQQHQSLVPSLPTNNYAVYNNNNNQPFVFVNIYWN